MYRFQNRVTICNFFIHALAVVEEGDIVAIALQNYLDFTDDTNVGDIFDKIESMADMESGSLLLRKSQKFDAFSIVFRKGEWNVVFWAA